MKSEKDGFATTGSPIMARSPRAAGWKEIPTGKFVWRRPLQGRSKHSHPESKGQLWCISKARNEEIFSTVQYLKAREPSKKTRRRASRARPAGHRPTHKNS